ncbi:unnamed protein product, partial [marine sediment metagenome]
MKSYTEFMLRWASPKKPQFAVDILTDAGYTSGAIQKMTINVAWDNLAKAIGLEAAGLALTGQYLPKAEAEAAIKNLFEPEVVAPLPEVTPPVAEVPVVPPEAVPPVAGVPAVAEVPVLPEAIPPVAEVPPTVVEKVKVPEIKEVPTTIIEEGGIPISPEEPIASGVADNVPILKDVGLKEKGRMSRKV